jgi:hypothetical protein
MAKTKGPYGGRWKSGDTLDQGGQAAFPTPSPPSPHDEWPDKADDLLAFVQSEVFPELIRGGPQ